MTNDSLALLRRNFLEEFQHLHSQILQMKRASDAIHFRKRPGRLRLLRWWNTRMPRWIVTRSPWQVDAVMGRIVPDQLQLALVEQWKSFFGTVNNSIGHLSKFHENCLPHEQRRGRRSGSVTAWLGLIKAGDPELSIHVEVLEDAVGFRDKVVVHPSGTGSRVFDWLTMEACIEEVCLVAPVWFSQQRDPDVPLIDPGDDDYDPMDTRGPYAEGFVPPVTCAEFWVAPWPPHVVIAFASVAMLLTQGQAMPITWDELAPPGRPRGRGRWRRSRA